MDRISGGFFANPSCMNNSRRREAYGFHADTDLPESRAFVCGYPYTLGVTMENLLEAAKGENEEAARAYPAFARTAREEGYADAAALWENIARIEAMHRDVFLESYNQMQTERLYRKERPIVWRCLNCGFVLLAKEAFRVCPVCGKDRGWAEGDIETRRLGKEG